ncbi:hypothetical protein [Aliiroseovarius pelagivivens]|uniref:hypothetical protein n=1 Tax=Aliiroseovarius pelagivivens TaxID=1639690 RepID=UPI0015E8052B|nr:hypothetical protein [Aliiroseovarius pelagivivens]
MSKFLHGKSPNFQAQDSLAELPGKGVVFQKGFALLQNAGMPGIGGRGFAPLRGAHSPQDISGKKMRIGFGLG